MCIIKQLCKNVLQGILFCLQRFCFQAASCLCIFLFALMQKETKKSRQTLSSAALPCLPLHRCNSALFYFLSCGVIVHHWLFIFQLLLLPRFSLSLNSRFKSACEQFLFTNRCRYCRFLSLFLSRNCYVFKFGCCDVHYLVRTMCNQAELLLSSPVVSLTCALITTIQQTSHMFLKINLLIHYSTLNIQVKNLVYFLEY